MSKRRDRIERAKKRTPAQTQFLRDVERAAPYSLKSNRFIPAREYATMKREPRQAVRLSPGKEQRRQERAAILESGKLRKQKTAVVEAEMIEAIVKVVNNRFAP